MRKSRAHAVKLDAPCTRFVDLCDTFGFIKYSEWPAAKVLTCCRAAAKPARGDMETGEEAPRPP